MGGMNRHRRAAVLLYGFIMLLAAAGICAAAEGKPRGKAVKLFGTMAFKTSMRAVPQWTRVLSLADEQVQRLTGCSGAACPAAARSWQAVLKQAGGLPVMERLAAVNRYFNRWPYRLDIERFGVNDYWATPEEFLTLSGDCEDYSIAKYFALKQLGIDRRAMRIVVVKDRIRNVAHAVLAVDLDGTAYILDNLSDPVQPQERYSHYLPQYSVNEAGCWAHIGGTGQADKGK